MNANPRLRKSWRHRWLFLLLTIALILCAGSFLIAAVLAEGAVHPLFRRRASDTAALAYSVSASLNGHARKVSVRSDDGLRLSGWWLTPERTNSRAVIVCHGVADSAYGVLGFALLFLRSGYSILVPESRGHGESPGFVTYGVREAKDTVRWLHWMKSQGVKESFGFGESLGAAILIQSLAEGADFRAVIAESPYFSFKAVAEERVARVVPAPLARLLVEEGILYTRLRYGVNLSLANTGTAIQHAHTPILLIHGLADDETSPENSRRLHRENPEFTTLWLVPGARHTGAYAAQPSAFQERVLLWFSH